MLDYTPEFSGQLDFVRDDDAGLYYYGVNLDGALLKLGAVKIGKVEKWQRLASEANEQAKASKSAKK